MCGRDGTDIKEINGHIANRTEQGDFTNGNDDKEDEQGEKEENGISNETSFVNSNLIGTN